MKDDEIYTALDGLTWSAARAGRKWSSSEMLAKIDQLPFKLEVVQGQLFWEDFQRVRVFAALLEHLGLDAAQKVINAIGGSPQCDDVPPADPASSRLASDPDDGLDPCDGMPAVGRERFWLPAAKRYPFKTLLELKHMKRASSGSRFTRQKQRSSKDNLARLKKTI